MVTGLYAGSFDPITNGHLDIIKRSMKFCDQLIVVIGVNTSKKTMFSEKERLSLVKETISKEVNFLDATNIQSIIYSGLIVDLAKEKNASLLIRGIRSVSDFEYEINLANINKTLVPNIETVFMPTRPEMAVVSSSALKEIARFGGDISKFAPEQVVNAVKSKYGFVKYGDV